MLLKELRIDSFGRFRGRKLLLSDGMNILYGGNAAGKSTVRDFVLFVLFGKEAESQMQVSSLEAYMPRGGGRLEGQIDFSFQGKDYRAMRLYGEGKHAFAVISLPSGADALGGGSRIQDLLPITPQDLPNEIRISSADAGADNEEMDRLQAEKEKLLDQIRQLQKEQAGTSESDYEEKKKAASLIEENNALARAYQEKKAQLTALLEEEKTHPHAGSGADTYRRYEDLRVEYEDLRFTQQELAAQSGGGALKAAALALPALGLALLVFLAGSAVGVPQGVRSILSLLLTFLAFLIFLLVLASASGKQRRSRRLGKKADAISGKMQEILKNAGAHSREELRTMRHSGIASPAVRQLKEEMASLESRYQQLQGPLKPYLEKYGDTIVLDEGAGAGSRDHSQEIAALKARLFDLQRQIGILGEGSSRTGMQGQEALPLILDGYFSSFDDDRLQTTLAWLARQESFSQIIILTCHRREQSILETQGISCLCQDLN